MTTWAHLKRIGGVSGPVAVPVGDWLTSGLGSVVDFAEVKLTASASTKPLIFNSFRLGMVSIWGEESSKMDLSSSWVWALAVSGIFFAKTRFALGLLNEARKEDISLWLLGARKDTWCSSFLDIFDVVFGNRHFGAKRIIRSAMASLLSVTAMYAAFSVSGLLEGRIAASGEFWLIAAMCLLINLVADFFSLIETRLVIEISGRTDRFIYQFLLLVCDLVVSALIVLPAIWFASLLLNNIYEEPEMAELFGIFSIYSIFFYSTFITSIWSIGYLLSTWFVGFFTYNTLDDWLDVEKKPETALSIVGAGFIFCGALAVSFGFAKSETTGLSKVDEALCWVLPGRVCAKVANIAIDEPSRLDYMLRTCSAGVSRECFEFAAMVVASRPNDSAELFRSSCENGNSLGCIGVQLSVERLWLSLETVTGVNEICEGASIEECQIRFGIEAVENETEAYLFIYSYYHRNRCLDSEPRIAESCTALGSMFLHKFSAYQSSDTSNEENRLNAFLYHYVGCEAGDPKGCYSLGLDYQFGIGTEASIANAAQYFGKACMMEDAKSCHLLQLQASHFGVLENAVEFGERACELDNDYC